MEKQNKIMEFLKTSTGRIVLIIVLYVIIFGIEYAMLSVFSENPGVIFVILCAIFVYFGWKALSKITPNLFLIMPLGHWFWYWFIKGILALFVGPFIAPYQIAKMILNNIN